MGKNTLVGAELAYFDRSGIRASFKSQVANVAQRTATLSRRDRNKYSEYGAG